jgi:pyruvate dehydrogenase E2 component (dihydrolipoyllysine-residue acetyltransferase)
VDKLNLAQLAIEAKRVISDARRGVVANAGQGVFTISNLGMHGVDDFCAIINPPEAAILAVGAAREKVVVENGCMRAGRTIALTLSADHRLVDGAAAAKFLAQLRSLLELRDEGWWI